MTKSKMINTLKIVLAGGGSGGPVTPLLAIAEELREQLPETIFLFIGTKTGPERSMVENSGIDFKSIQAGKWRRYGSFKNLLTPFLVIGGMWQAWKILRQFQPNVVVGAGGFVQVPVIWTAWLQRVPVLIHQQDVLPSLANVLASPFAKKITVTFEHSLKHFSQGSGLFEKKHDNKVIWTGNPFRKTLQQANKDEARAYFHLTSDLPVLFVTGGGTGARELNRIVLAAAPQLCSFMQIIHGTGVGKKMSFEHPHYHPYEFTDRMDLAYAVSDLVICRAGLATITELANLGKVAIIIPMPDSHQEHNAALVWQHQAALVIDQTQLAPERLAQFIRKLLFDRERQEVLKKNMRSLMPPHATEKVASIVRKLASQ